MGSRFRIGLYGLGLGFLPHIEGLLIPRDVVIFEMICWQPKSWPLLSGNPDVGPSSRTYSSIGDLVIDSGHLGGNIKPYPSHSCIQAQAGPSHVATPALLTQPPKTAQDLFPAAIQPLKGYPSHVATLGNIKMIGWLECGWGRGLVAEWLSG